jgi:hypothetical protein
VGPGAPFALGFCLAWGLLNRERFHQRLGSPTGLRPGPPTLRGGLKDRARPAARVLDPAPLLGRVLRCAAMALSHVCSHAHPHLLRRRWIGGSSTRFLLALSEACCFHSWPRLGELVDQELFERQSAAPALPVNPELEKLVPF